LSLSSIEIARMERTIAWPAHYLKDVSQVLRTVQLAAFGRARHRDLHWVARKLELSGRLVHRWNRRRASPSLEDAPLQRRVAAMLG
jgi:hypothetical protein